MAKQVPERDRSTGAGSGPRKAAVADGPRRNRLWRDLALIAIAPALLYLLASLFTYSPTDPGWSQAGSVVAPIHNMGGRVGAWIADVLRQLFGYVAYLIPLMLAATVLTVVFATRGAMAGNGHIIEVLHFVGAEARFIAREFRRHFLVTGMKGAAAGGVAAAVVFVVFSWWSARSVATPGGDQATALFGHFAIGWSGYLGVLLMVLVIGALTAATSHVTVVAHLSDLDTRQTDGT